MFLLALPLVLCPGKPHLAENFNAVEMPLAIVFTSQHEES